MIKHSGVVGDCYRSAQMYAIPELQDYDWYCAFTPAAKMLDYDTHNIRSVVAKDEGIHDEKNWIGIFKTKDNKYIVINAGCDYTGWDCRSSGEAHLCDTLEEAKSVIDLNDLVRLGLVEKREAA